MQLENILKKLIAFPTVSGDQEANKYALDWIEQQVKHLPLFIRAHTHNNYPSLVITTKKTLSPTLLLQAHIDVVPGSSSAFMPRLSKTRLYGRGAFDMKFAIAAYTKLLLDLGDDLKKYNFGIMLTSDEEMGGRDGVRPLVHERGYRANVVFLPDGGENWKFEKTSKGIMRICVKSHGKTAHGAYPWLGLDANTELASYITDIRKEFDSLTTNDPNHLYPTLNVGLINGGNAINQVSEFAEAKLDIRIPHDYPNNSIDKLLSRAGKKYPHIRIHKLSHTQGFETNTADEYHSAFSDIVKKIRGRRPGRIDAHGSSDAKYFREFGIPVILIRPRGGKQHSEQEWIDLNDLSVYYQCLRKFVEQTSAL